MTAEREQSEIVDWLARPETYGLASGGVEHLTTHISHLFLAGEHAFKLKRAIRREYLDFSTEPLRRAACEAELRLNRRTAPDLYLAVKPILRGADGTLAFGEADAAPGNGARPVDWVVVMRRFDGAMLLDRMAERGALDAPLVSALVRAIADFHARAEAMPLHGGAAAVERLIRMNDAALAASGCDAAATRRLRDASFPVLARLSPLLEARRRNGRVRRCHGDLHLGNICVVDGDPTLFDCIEFSEDLAAIDVLYDLAFLVMDLVHRDCGFLANRVMNEYLDRTGDDDGIAAFPLFLSLRAAVRAHVAALSPEPPRRAEAAPYLQLALRFLDAPAVRLVAVGGLSGTGKSSVAARLAPALPPAPGARVLRSDALRKRLHGCALEERLPEAAYSRREAARVYAELSRLAEQTLAGGRSVILDAVGARPEERLAFARTAAQAGVRFDGLWLEAPAATLAARLVSRRGDVSDATPAVLAQQQEYEIGALDWRRLDAGRDLAATVADAGAVLGLR